MAALVAIAVTLTSGPVRADVIVPDEGACAGKTAGAECTVKPSGKGLCTASKCNRLDYTDGSPPTTKVVDCLLCEVGGASDAAVPPGRDSGSGSGSGQDGGSASTSNTDDGGCSLSATPLARDVGPWALALLPLLVFHRRSKKSRK